MSPEDAELERKHYETILKSFADYHPHMSQYLNKKKKDLDKLPKQHQQIIRTSLDDLYASLQFAADENNKFLTNLYEEELDLSRESQMSSPDQIEKVMSTLRQLVRDWSSQGEQERQQTYGPILSLVHQIYKEIPLEERGSVKVLVPGAGLGRLVFELVRLGFSAQGNEFSFHMLIASNHVLNRYQLLLKNESIEWLKRLNIP